MEFLWRSWSEITDCDAAKSLIFAGLTSQVFKFSMFNGEALALPLWLKERRFSTVLQLVEPDRLSNSDGKHDSKTLRSGIEIDSYGAPKAYWIRKNHLGGKAIWTSPCAAYC